SYGRAELPAVKIKSLVLALSSPNQRPFHSEPPRAGEQKRPAFSLPSPLCVRIRLSRRTRIRRFDRSACPHGPTADRRVRGSSVQCRSCSVSYLAVFGAGSNAGRRSTREEIWRADLFGSRSA